MLSINICLGMWGGRGVKLEHSHLARNHRHGPAVLTAFLAFGIALCLNPSEIKGQTIQPSAEDARGNSSKPAVAASMPYYIEFRARNAQSYGHTFSMYGRLNAQGEMVTKAVAGLHPFTESALPWMVGHLIMVPSETGPSDGDLEDQYVLARFRVALSAAEYEKVTTFIKDLQNRSPVWHASLYNCNAFVGDIARFMGLETPMSTLLGPEEYVNGLRDLNKSKVNVAGVIGTPVSVDDPKKLRADALKAIEQREKRAAVGPTEQTPSQTRNAAPAAASRPPALDRKTAPRGPVSKRYEQKT
jgi:hypothetical protein